MQEFGAVENGCGGCGGVGRGAAAAAAAAAAGEVGEVEGGQVGVVGLEWGPDGAGAAAALGHLVQPVVGGYGNGVAVLGQLRPVVGVRRGAVEVGVATTYRVGKVARC